MRSTRSPSWISRFASPRPLFALGEGGPGARQRSGRHGAWSRLLGLAPVPAPPHVFEIDAAGIRYAAFARRGSGWELTGLTEAELPAETFQAGPLGGPLRGREGFDDALDKVLPAESPPEASLVLPDRWLRLLFTDLEEDLGRNPSDEILRFKLKKLVPFRVDDLRVRATIVPGFPSQTCSRLLFAFAIEQLVRELETAFQARGVRIGQVASRSLYLLSLLREREDAGKGLLTISLESDGYSLCYLASGVPYVVRYRAASADPRDPAQAAHIAQDLRILLSFLAEHLPNIPVTEAVVCGEPEAALPWVELLNDRFDFVSRSLSARDLPLAAPASNLAWHRVAPLLAAATREIA